MKFNKTEFKKIILYLIRLIWQGFSKFPGWAKILTVLIFLGLILEAWEGVNVKFKELTQPSQVVINAPADSPETDPFSDGVSKATNAAKLTQTAQTLDEWNQVADEWQAAINFMKVVSPTNQNYEAAQQRIITYPNNLAYAQKNAESLKQEESKAALSKCTKAGGKIWADVRLYRDSNCKRVFATVIGGGKLKNGQRGVLIKFDTGEIEWKIRRAVADQAYVKADDPARASRLWREIDQ